MEISQHFFKDLPYAGAAWATTAGAAWATTAGAATTLAWTIGADFETTALNPVERGRERMSVFVTIRIGLRLTVDVIGGVVNSAD